MKKRKLTELVQNLATQYPIITITGPRQSGKTTLAKMAFPDMQYVNLENPDYRRLALADGRSFLDRFPDNTIIDEVQRVPELLSYLQVHVDAQPKMGRYILTGSNQFQYMQSISQSLAGRTAMIQLLPFSIDEIYKDADISLEKAIYTGFYPAIFDRQIDPTRYYSDYLETYLTRDVRQIATVHDLSTFEQFIRLCAGRCGQLLNLESLGNELGVNAKTIRRWLNILQASYIIFLLPPYYRNFNKRITKTPKLYFFDAGLAAFLLNIENAVQLETHPLRGNLFENLVIGEFLKMRYNRGSRANMYFLRDQNGREVDLLLETGGKLLPIEIKSAKSINKSLFKGLNYFKKILPECDQTYLVYAGDLQGKWQDHELVRFNCIVNKF